MIGRLGWAAIVLTVASAGLVLGVLPATGQDPPAACTRVSLPVVVDLSNDRHATLIAHERAAIDRGQPRFLTWDPAGADRRRREDLRGIPTRAGFDRDEYPPASTVEGGLQPDGTSASVAYVPSAENRSGGQLLGSRMRGFCAGQRLVIEAGRP